MNQAVKNSFNNFFNKNDIFLRTMSTFNPSEPLKIENDDFIYEVNHGFRDAHAFRIDCKITSKAKNSSKSTTLSFSSKNSSYIKLVEKFGLSQEAKKLYKGLDIYDCHFSGQANLTTMRWNPHPSQAQMHAVSDFGKDLIFDGEMIAPSKLMCDLNFKLYKSYRKENEFVVSYEIENLKSKTPLKVFKILSEPSLMLSFELKSDLMAYLENLENFWDFKYVY